MTSPSGATLQVLERAGQEMGLVDEARRDDEPRSGLNRAASRCWAMLLARLFECLPLRCTHCGHPMRIIAFVTDRPVIERILRHMDEPIHPPEILPSRSPPQLTIPLDQEPDLGMNQDPGPDPWPDLDQSGGADQDTRV
jgi:hypothetical protein